ncbi:MAG: hypothetical protein JF563_05920 [Acidobacteriales bacterium]|nr:hypothetical protein [Terriglobales bacterium]
MQPYLVEKRLDLEGHAAHIIPIDAGHWIKINSQFVRMIEIARSNGMRMQFDTAQINDPGKSSRIVNNDLFRGASRRK